MMGRRYRAPLLAATVGLVAGACSSSTHKPPPEVGERWERADTWPHQDVIGFDNVAVGTSPGNVAWFTRRARGETSALAYLEIRDGDDAVEIEVPTPDDRVVIPVAVATEDDGWAVVAVTRDRANGENTGLMAWTGRSGSEPVVAPGELLPRLGEIAPPESVSLGRSAGTTVVTALLDGVPLIWDSATDDAAWEAAPADLGLEDDLVSLRVVGDGTRLVLAGVDASGAAHLWSSTNGDSWDPVAAGQLPDDVGAIGFLAPVARGQVAVGWLDDEDGTPPSTTAATIHVVEGDDASGRGRITADGAAQDRFRVAGATTSPDGRLVVVGAALRTGGTPTPMVWVRDDDQWLPTEQEDLSGRLDYHLRAVTTTRDDTMLGLVTAIGHIDVESWLWQPDG